MQCRARMWPSFVGGRVGADSEQHVGGHVDSAGNSPTSLRQVQMLQSTVLIVSANNISQFTGKMRIVIATRLNENESQWRGLSRRQFRSVPGSVSHGPRLLGLVDKLTS